MLRTYYSLKSIKMSESKSNHWSTGLIQSMKDPNLQVISNDIAVVIKDKYPKAKHHYLILPWNNIPSIYHLSRKHANLMTELELLAQNVIEIIGEPTENFKIGYHASPSMQRLHVHVISKDFDSICLKTKIHWNSFCTDFFLPIQDVHAKILTDGELKKMPEATCKEFITKELQCHRCAYKPKNMPDLKQHILVCRMK